VQREASLRSASGGVNAPPDKKALSTKIFSRRKNESAFSEFSRAPPRNFGSTARRTVGLVTEKLARGSRQKSRLLPAADEVMSEKSALATFFECTSA
jgi:hypothetical protein